MKMTDFPFPWNKKRQEKDSVYFNSKNTEIVQLEQELESMKVPQQKEAMKEIIAGMTIGKDVSRLFPHVVNCMRTNDLELKKLIYLYIINYAKVKPSESILAVNSFLLDANDVDSPIIRALAIRTMGCIRVEEIVSYLCETLKNGLSDSDAYVKKTSCICVAKLYSTCPELVKDNGLIEQLKNMLDDGNATVLSSAIAALSEISLLSGSDYLELNSKLLKKILMALNDANEWGQIYILDSLMTYKKSKSSKSEMIIEAVVPLFNHINPAVIMSAIKVVLKFLDNIEDEKINGKTNNLGSHRKVLSVNKKPVKKLVSYDIRTIKKYNLNSSPKMVKNGEKLQKKNTKFKSKFTSEKLYNSKSQKQLFIMDKNELKNNNTNDNEKKNNGTCLYNDKNGNKKNLKKKEIASFFKPKNKLFSRWNSSKSVVTSNYSSNKSNNKTLLFNKDKINESIKFCSATSSLSNSKNSLDIKDSSKKNFLSSIFGESNQSNNKNKLLDSNNSIHAINVSENHKKNEREDISINNNITYRENETTSHNLIERKNSGNSNISFNQNNKDLLNRI